MALSSLINRKLYTGNGVTTTFSFPYLFQVDADLVVLKTEISSGAVTTLTLNSDYTVTGAGTTSGNVVFATAPSALFDITIYRDPALTQEVTFTDGPLSADSLNDVSDKAMMIAQRLSERMDRAMVLNDGDQASVSATLPVAQASKPLRWNAAADALENFTISAGAVVSASTAAEGIVELATQAEVDSGVSATLAVTPATLAGSALAMRVTSTETDIDNLQAANTQSNVLINSNFAVNQRVVTTAAADDTYCLDRWNLLTQTGAITIAQQTDQENGTPFNIRLTQAQAVAQRIGLEQIVESGNCKFLRGNSVAAKARVRISNSQAVRYAILEWTSTADSVTSDVVLSWTSGTYTAGNFFLAANLTVVAVGAVTPAANTWTDLTAITGTVSSSMNNLIFMIWTEGTAAQNVTLDIARAQLVAGTTVPTFQNDAFDVALRRCQRYYFKTFAQGTKPANGLGDLTYPAYGAQTVGASLANNGGIRIPFPVTMRATNPVFYNPVNANGEVYNVTKSLDCSGTAQVAAGALDSISVKFTSVATAVAGDAVAIHVAVSGEL